MFNCQCFDDIVIHANNLIQGQILDYLDTVITIKQGHTEAECLQNKLSWPFRSIKIHGS